MNVPCRMVNSPTNPLSSGSPIEDINMMSVIVAYTGMTLEMPPYSEISRVCRRSYRMPTIKNSAPVEMPWLICCSTEPLSPSGLRAKMPSVQKPRWLTEEYAWAPTCAKSDMKGDSATTEATVVTSSMKM